MFSTYSNAVQYVYSDNKLVTSYNVKKVKTAINKAAKEYPELVKRGIIVQRRLNIGYAPKTLES